MEGGEPLTTIHNQSRKLLLQALRQGASDIHLSGTREDGIIQFRLNGRLAPFQRIPLQTAERLVSHFKFSAGLDIGERRKPQSGAMDLILEQKIPVSLRVSTLPTPLFEAVAIRLHPQQTPFALESIPLIKRQAQQLISLMTRTQGLILLTGATGSGKTTTLYAMLQKALHMQNLHIVTIEDPIEQLNPAFTQFEMNEKAQLTYEVGLKAALRHDPDVIMIGEIRDQTTAVYAVRAALTGHLVLATIHSANARGTITRLCEMGVALHDLREVVVAIIAQELISRKCPLCLSSDCSPYCTWLNNRKRAAIFDILEGKALQEALTANDSSFDGLGKERRFAIALGYIEEKEAKNRAL